jgi:uncharacterized membrane protein
MFDTMFISQCSRLAIQVMVLAAAVMPISMTEKGHPSHTELARVKKMFLWSEFGLCLWAVFVLFK